MATHLYTVTFEVETDIEDAGEVETLVREGLETIPLDPYFDSLNIDVEHVGEEDD